MKYSFFIRSFCLAALVQPIFSAENYLTTNFMEDSKFSNLQQYLTSCPTEGYSEDFGRIISNKPFAIFMPPRLTYYKHFYNFQHPIKQK